MYFFRSFLVVFRICFLILIRIYLLYLCCSIGPSHSVWWSLFVWRFDELSSLVRSIPKHNMLVIGGDMNAQIGKNGNNKYSLHNTPNRNGQHLTDFMIENRLACLNTNYQKKGGQTLDIHVRKQY